MFLKLNAVLTLDNADDLSFRARGEDNKSGAVSLYLFARIRVAAILPTAKRTLKYSRRVAFSLINFSRATLSPEDLG